MNRTTIRLRRTLILCGVCLAAALASPALAADPAASGMRDVEHPFILWTAEEARQIRQRIENDPLARAQYDRMASTAISSQNRTLWNLFNYMVMGDEQAGQRELAELLRFIGHKPEPLTWGVAVEDLAWHVGGPSRGDRHMRDEQTLHTLRYDVLYHRLTDEQRRGVQAAMRSYIDFHLSGHQPRHPDFRYTRTGWLPNMHWPRAIGTHLMAVALKDEDLIRRMFEGEGGFKWYFDEYLADGRFYMEEFGKHYSNLGTKLMYCEALERLGLGQYGYGYTGRGGATVLRRLQMLPWLGYPRLEALQGGTPEYAAVSMGDAGETGFVGGYDHGGRGGSRWWSNAHMNGPLPKLGVHGWFEIANRRWPDQHFDYFLAQMRMPGDERYLPSLYFGGEPIDPAQVSPPAAPSYVARERGFALLRAEESPAYWESPSPAVALQFGMYYVHYVHDCFALMQYVANNRMIYNRMGSTQRGYAGNDAWRDHVRGHSGVVVDGLRARWVDNGNEGVANHEIRENLDGPARFVLARAQGIYPDVDQTRAMVLTHEYLFDLSRLVSDRPRTYDWQVLAPLAGLRPVDGQQWRSADDLNGAIRGRRLERSHLTRMQVLDAAAGPWEARLVQARPNANGDAAIAAWNDRGVGVRVQMLPEPGTLVKVSRPPIGENEIGVSLMVSREAPSTVFAALHEPFEGGSAGVPATRFTRIAENDRGLAARVGGERQPVNDRILLAWGDGAQEVQTLEGGGERFVFAGFGFVRVTDEAVTVQGDVRELTVQAPRGAKLIVNGQEVSARHSGGRLVWNAR